MDPRSMTPAASSLLFLCANIVRAIKNVKEKYNAAQTTSSISLECASISSTLLDIQSALTEPHALSVRAIPQGRLEGGLNNAQKCCNVTVARLGEEMGKCVGNQQVTGKGPHTWNMTYPYDEILIKELLQQLERQLIDINSLITAAQRNNILEIRQLLAHDTFIGDSVDAGDVMDSPTSTSPGEYKQALWERFDSDSKSVCAQSSASVSNYSLYSGRSEAYSVFGDDGDADATASKSHLIPPQFDRSKKVPSARMGSIFFKLFKSNTDFHRAAKKGDAKKMKALLALGVDINYEGSSGCTALHLATDCGHEAVVRMLLDNGADPTLKSSEGRTPLHSAARNGHTSVIRLLLDKGADVKSKDPSGSTALHIAAYNGHESAVHILLEKYPFVEIRGPSGFTALHVAAFSGQSAVVRLLVEMGAELEARSDTGRTALQLAAEKGHEAVVRHLLQHGVNIMVRDNSGRTAIQGAVSNRHGVVAQLLLDRVVDASSNPQQQASSISGPVFELGVVEPTFTMPELDGIELPPTQSRQVISETIYELPDSSAELEPPTDPTEDLNASPRNTSSITRRTTPRTNRRRPRGT